MTHGLAGSVWSRYAYAVYLLNLRWSVVYRSRWHPLASLMLFASLTCGCVPRSMRDLDGDRCYNEQDDSGGPNSCGSPLGADSGRLDSGRSDADASDTGPPETGGGTGNDMPLDPGTLDCTDRDELEQALRARENTLLWVDQLESQTIAAALANAENGDYICVKGADEGTTFTGRLTIDKNIWLEAVGAVSIVGDGTGPTLAVSADATIRGFSLSNTAITVSTFLATSSICDDNALEAGDCSLIAVSDGSPTFDNVRLSGGAAKVGAGVYVASGTPTFKDVEIAYSGMLGRGLIAKENDHLSDNDISLEIPWNTEVSPEPPYPIVDPASLGITSASSAVSYSVVAEKGGAIYVAGGEVTFDRLLVHDCGATNGSALYVSSGARVTVTHGTLIDPDVDVTGVGSTAFVEAGGSLTLKNTMIRGAVSSAVIEAASSATVTATDTDLWASDRISPSFTLHSSDNVALGLDPWRWWTPSSFGIPSSADPFFTDPDGNPETDDYVGAVEP